MPPVPDLGLDAVQVQSDGEIFFSITDSAFSEQLGITLGPGDLLSNAGRRVRSAKDLVAALRPTEPDVDVGLDAVYVWPSGEIWFSTKMGFNTPSGQVGAGDLLSDQGYVVFGNLELVREFGPLEDLADFGLDALWIVSDATSNAARPRLVSITLETNPPAIRLEADGLGSALQIEKAAEPTGPYTPLGSIGPEVEWIDAFDGAPSGRAFYRLRQW
jgi:hypothetical protein